MAVVALLGTPTLSLSLCKTNPPASPGLSISRAFYLQGNVVLLCLEFFLWPAKEPSFPGAAVGALLRALRR
jgi:hypothetical protein